MDYIRTVFFHNEAPWIVSASDDQTIRVWNWQSRACLAVLTGHSHYVMCAQFHPSEDMIVSASLDQTIRVWDVGSLRRKHSSPATSPYDESGARISSPRASQIDLFGAPEGQVKFVLEGHDRGVNWVQFHPTKPIIVSGSDDRSVKLWRYNETRAWETDTFRGHFNNISCVMFHAQSDLIISNSEDKSIRIWDYTKRGSQPIVQRRDSDRFWILAGHPSLNLIAAGHDNGLMVFKLEHERPSYCVFEENQLFVLRDRTVVSVDLNGDERGAENSQTSILNLDHKATPPSLLVHSVADNSLLLSSRGDAASYELFSARGGSGDSLRKGPGESAVFVARNRFAVLDEQQVHIKALDNTVYKTIECENVERILPCPPGSLLFVTKENVRLYDFQQDKFVAESKLTDIKYCVWSSDSNSLALFGSHVLYVVDRRTLAVKATVRDTINIKSAVWDARGILFFTNSHHLKYLLPNGDVGVICTVQAPLYLIRVKGDTISALDRSCAVHHFKIDPTEFLFKLALLQGDQPTILHMIEHGNLMGQSIISYLRQNGYAEIALGFVQEPVTRFELGIECCDLDCAYEAAEKMGSDDMWNRLADEAMMIGNFVLAEKCFRRVGNHSRLSFLHLLTGNVSKLQSVTDEARVKGDFNTRIQNDLFLGDNVDLANALVDAKVPSLAYLACKSSGLEIEGQDILDRFCHDKANAHSLPVGRIAQVEPLFRQSEAWPLNADPVKNKIALTRKPPITRNPTDSLGELLQTEAFPASGGWDLEETGLELELDDIPSPSGDADFSNIAEDGAWPQPGNEVKELLSLASSIPYHYLATGQVETALALMQEQCGIVNFGPLESMVMRCIQGSAVPIEGFTGAILDATCQTEKEGHSASRPRPVFTFELLKQEFDAALQLTTTGKFSEAVKLFENVLLSCLFTVVTTAEEDEFLEVKSKCREYLLGLRMEHLRKELLGTDEARSLALACYFASCDLRNDHRILALRSALTQAYKQQCIALSCALAKRLLQCSPPEATALQARKIIGLGERLPLNHVDPIVISLGDESAPIIIDARDIVPLDGECIECPFCQAKYRTEYHASVCAVCNVASVGADGTGLVCCE
jgi:coatomer protein complex subunit alpha (xenin)